MIALTEKIIDLKKLLPLSTVILNSLALSDQISLKNGDFLQGTLTSQTDTFVLWQSDNFGELQIPVDQVVSISPAPETKELITGLNEKDTFKGCVGLSGSYLGGNEERDDLELDIGFSFEKGDATHSAKINMRPWAKTANQPLMIMVLTMALIG